MREFQDDDMVSSGRLDEGLNHLDHVWTAGRLLQLLHLVLEAGRELLRRLDGLLHQEDLDSEGGAVVGGGTEDPPKGPAAEVLLQPVGSAMGVKAGVVVRQEKEQLWEQSSICIVELTCRRVRPRGRSRGVGEWRRPSIPLASVSSAALDERGLKLSRKA